MKQSKPPFCFDIFEGLTKRNNFSWLLELVAVLVLIVFYADAATLPLSVTAASTTSVDDTVPSGGTTLATTDMLAAAASSSQSAAVFDATRLTHLGTITIMCPTTVADWDTYNIPLHLTFRNGTSTSLSITFKLEGVLGKGSVISVLGGTFVFNSIVRTSSLLELTQSSTLEIVDLVGSQIPSVYLSSILLLYTTGLRVGNGSTIRIENNTVLAGSASYNYANCALNHHATLFQINENSSYIVVGNVLSMADLTFTSSSFYARVVIMMAFVNVTQGSRFLVRDNVMSASHVSFYAEVNAYIVNVQALDASVSDSEWAVDGNRIVFTNRCTFGSSSAFYATSFNFLSVTGSGSSMSHCSNSLVFNNSSSISSTTSYAISASVLSLGENTWFNASDNFLLCSDVATSQFTTSVVYIRSSTPVTMRGIAVVQQNTLAFSGVATMNLLKLVLLRIPAAPFNCSVLTTSLAVCGNLINIASALSTSFSTSAAYVVQAVAPNFNITLANNTIEITNVSLPALVVAVYYSESATPFVISSLTTWDMGGSTLSLTNVAATASITAYIYYAVASSAFTALAWSTDNCVVSVVNVTVPALTIVGIAATTRSNTFSGAARFSVANFTASLRAITATTSLSFAPIKIDQGIVDASSVDVDASHVMLKNITAPSTSTISVLNLGTLTLMVTCQFAALSLL